MTQLGKSQTEMLALFVNGLREAIKQQVILRDPKDIDDAEYAAKLCESVSAISRTPPTVAAVEPAISTVLQELRKELQAQGEKLQAISRPERPQNGQQTEERPRRDRDHNYQPRQWSSHNGNPAAAYPQRPRLFQQTKYRQPRQSNNRRQLGSYNPRTADPPVMPANQQTCTQCHKWGHYARECRGAIVCNSCGRQGHTMKYCGQGNF